MTEAQALTIRRAHEGDAATIARHRADMFRDMGQLPDGVRDGLEEATRTQLTLALRTGEYVGWLVETDGDPRQVVAGGGALVRARLPHAATVAGVPRVFAGREAIVYNMFTEPAWRRRGLARRLMDEILAWARASDVDRLVLHASDEGRPLYASLGFVATNEMRFGSPLR